MISLSIVIPTLNSGKTISDCLLSLRAQDYPRDKMEILIADGGSTDGTLEIARQILDVTVVPNPLKTGEAGKAAGIQASHGEIICLVDSDNILPGSDWLSKMLAPFCDEQIVASEPVRYDRRPDDPPLTRYFAMLGMNDPLCLFLGNYDRESMITGRWTDMPVFPEQKDGYLKVRLNSAHLPTIGANGFVFRRSLLDVVKWQPYFFDIDIMSQAVAAGRDRIAKVDCGIVHLYCSSLRDFRRKQRRRIRDYLHFQGTGVRHYEWQAGRAMGIARFCISTLLVIPLLRQMWNGWRRCKDWAWLYHVPCCWATLWTYVWCTIASRIGLGRVESRRGWTQ